MRRVALLGLLMVLTGCGTRFGEFLSDTHTFQSNPNLPPIESDNMRRVIGEETDQQPLTPEAGNIWPPPAGPMPTLMDLEQQNGQPGATGAPASGYGGNLPAAPRGPEAPMAMPGATTLPSMPPAFKPNAPAPAIPPAAGSTGAGAGAGAGAGGAGLGTINSPQGQSIVVPNGNGTSTIIHPDGTVETVPTPKQ